MKTPSNPQKSGVVSAWLSLLTCSGTLICCALPALLVTIGAGAALASLVSAVPQLIVFSEHKGAVFGLALAMLVGNGIAQWRQRHRACAVGVDPEQAARCARTRQLSLRIYGLSVALFVVGGWFAFVQTALFP